jgi:hypothetical protein
VYRAKKLWGLLEYKPQWTLTLPGWLLLLSLLGMLAFILVTRIQPFLAMTARVKEAEILLIEGWIGDTAIQGAINEFHQGNYQIIIATGIKLYRGSFLSDYQSYAEVTAATLQKLGIPPQKIVTLPSPITERDRTAAAALEVKNWLEQNHPQLKRLNIYSSDVHTRRSWWIYQQVLGKEMQVGAIAHPNRYYNPQKWWESSNGFRSVTEEAIAYFYARFFWHQD